MGTSIYPTEKGCILRTAGGVSHLLGDKETRLLFALMCHPKLDRAGIVSALWDNEWDIPLHLSGAKRMHIYRLRRMLKDTEWKIVTRGWGDVRLERR